MAVAVAGGANRLRTPAGAAAASGEFASEGTAPALEVRGIGKRYGGRRVLSDVSFALQPGEAVALWGGNGAGKTTALRSILGIVHHEGEVEVAGISMSRDGAPRAARDRLRAAGRAATRTFPAPTCSEFFGALRGVRPDSARALAGSVGLEDHLAKRPGELSGGLRQRLALALAILGDPAVLLLDEPTANLDVETRDGIFRLLAEMRDRGMALLFTTHREDEVVALADRVITLRDGVVEREQDAGEFARHIRSGTAPLLIRVAASDIEHAEAVLRDAGIEARGRAGWIRVLHDAPAEPLRALWDAEIEVLESAIGGER